MKKVIQKTNSVLERINTGNAHEIESLPTSENNDKSKKPKKNVTGKALQMNEHSNKDIITNKKN